MKSEKEIKTRIEELQEGMRIADTCAEQLIIQDKMDALKWVLKERA